MVMASSTRRMVAALVAIATISSAALFGQPSPLPNRPDSLKFAAIGDNGTGDQPQYEVARQMTAFHERFSFDLVIMLGDNMYGGQSPADFVKKFEQPYATLLGAGVKFQASLGNHDRPENVSYKPYNMNGQRYYSYVRKNVRFLALDSTQMDRAQLAWIETTLRRRTRGVEDLLFPPPSLFECRPTRFLGRFARPPGADLRQHGVNVVFSGHDHVYERLKPQKGIYYFVSGSAGQLRKGNMDPAEQTAASFDQDQSFMLVEIAGADMFFQTISRTGRTVDSGVIHRQTARAQQ